jgi:hypothetical protein
MRLAMRVAKVYRVFLYGVATGLVIVLLFLVFGKWGLLAGVFLAPIISIFAGLPIDAFDLWLRRKSRDPVWLMTDEGREWLKTEDGRRWQALRR